MADAEDALGTTEEGKSGTNVETAATPTPTDDVATDSSPLAPAGDVGKDGTALSVETAEDGTALSVETAKDGEAMAAETEGDFVQEAVHEDDEIPLDAPWTKPDLKEALACRRRMIWNQGLRSYRGTTIKEMGAMGVGMYLYFWVLRVCAVAFLAFGLLSLPALLLNSQGNNGFALGETDIDGLGLVTLSYGHEGLDPTLVSSQDCSANLTDCSGKTVQAFGGAVEAYKVGGVITGMETLIFILFAIFIMWLSNALDEKIEEIDDANATPADYTVMVRGLPRDATEEEVRAHFHQRYALDEERPRFPFLGLSVKGVAVFLGVFLGVLFGLFAAPSIAVTLGKGPQAALFGFLFMLAVGLMVAGVVLWRKIGGPHPRETPKDAWARRRDIRKAEAGKKKRRKLGGKKYGAVLPTEEGNGQGGAQGGGDDGAEPGGGGATVAAEEPLTGGGDVEVGAQEEEEDHDVRFGQIPQPDPKPSQTYLHTRDKSYLGSWVSDVALGHPVGEALRCFMEEEETIAKIAKVKARVRQLRSQPPGCGGAQGRQKKLAKVEKKLEKLQGKEEAMKGEATKTLAPDCMDVTTAAFVLFEHEESQRRCIDDYRNSTSFLCRYFQPPELLFTHRDGTSYKIKVRAAPEPSDVAWENLDVPPMERTIRRAITWLACVVLLIGSFLIIYVAQVQQNIVEAQIPEAATCADAIPAVFFGTYDLPQGGVTLEHANGTADALCQNSTGDPNTYSILWKYGKEVNGSVTGSVYLDYDNLPRLLDPSGANYSRSSFSGSLCDSSCHSADTSATCDMLSCGVKDWQLEGFTCGTYPASAVVGCFCMDALRRQIEAFGLISGAQSVITTEGVMCTKFIKNYLRANIIKFVAVFAVVAVNSVLQGVMGKLAKFERQASVSDYTSTITIKLALAQFLNTALIVILVNAQYNGGGLGLLQDVGVLNGSYDDFDRGWYTTVGVAVTMTMLINIVVPHVNPLISEAFVSPIKRAIKSRAAATQGQLNNLYKPPRFAVEARYAFMMQVVFVTMLYSGGIPVMYFFAAFNFIFNFLVDKMWLIKLARQPPMYSEALAKMFVGILPPALMMHVFVTCYMLGNPDILNIGFMSAEAEVIAADAMGFTGLAANKVLRWHVFPLFLLGLVYLTLYVVYEIVGEPMIRVLKLLLRSVVQTCSCFKFLNRGEFSIPDEKRDMPGYTSEFVRVMGEGEALEADEVAMGWAMDEGGKTARWLFTDTGTGPGAVRHKQGEARRTWQVLAELGQYNYVMEESEEHKTACRYLAKAGFKSQKAITRGLVEGDKSKPVEPLTPMSPAGGGAGAGDGANDPEAGQGGGEGDKDGGGNTDGEAEQEGAKEGGPEKDVERECDKGGDEEAEKTEEEKEGDAGKEGEKQEEEEEEGEDKDTASQDKEGEREGEAGSDKDEKSKEEQEGEEAASERGKKGEREEEEEKSKEEEAGSDRDNAASHREEESKPDAEAAGDEKEEEGSKGGDEQEEKEGDNTGEENDE